MKNRRHPLSEEDVSLSQSLKFAEEDFFAYKRMKVPKNKRSRVFSSQIDNLNMDELLASLLHMIEEKEGPHLVTLLDPLKLIKIRWSKKLRSVIEKENNLMIADGAGVVWASQKAGEPLSERIPMIDLIMKILRVSVQYNYTIYLLGSSFVCLERVFFNFQRSFPGIRIVGRQEAFLGKKQEVLVKESLRKSSPDIIFLAMSFPRQIYWFAQNRKYLSKAVVIGVDSSLEILSGKLRKPFPFFQNRGLGWFWMTISRPWLLLWRFLPVVHYYISCYFSSFFKSDARKSFSTKGK